MELETTLGIDLIAVEIADEVDVLIDLATAAGANAVRLTIRPADAVPAFTLWNDLPVRGVDDGVMVELGDLHAGERRQVLLGFEVPGRPELGATSICELDLRWLDLASMTENVGTANRLDADHAPGHPSRRSLARATTSVSWEACSWSAGRTRASR